MTTCSRLNFLVTPGAHPGCTFYSGNVVYVPVRIFLCFTVVYFHLGGRLNSLIFHFFLRFLSPDLALSGCVVHVGIVDIKIYAEKKKNSALIAPSGNSS